MIRQVIRKCTANDRKEIFHIINDAARAYKGVIPQDRWHDPYMPMEDLEKEITEGVEFWGYQNNQGKLIGVMGIQDKGAVHLIRHAYVRTDHRRKGIGTKLLKFLEPLAGTPILIGTWADAYWAVDFYTRNGYRLVSEVEKNALLKRFWNIPERQVETSVVLADKTWTHARSITLSPR